MTLPRIDPMLATPGALPPVDEDERWAYETKYDGQRAVIYLPGDATVTLRSRSGADMTATYPELQPLGSALGNGVAAVLDGEVVALDERGRSDFQLLQSRMGLSGPPARIARMARDVAVHLVVFDVMFLRGGDTTSLPYAERRRELEGLALRGSHWSTPAAMVGHGERVWEATRQDGLEGVVRKRLDSAYTPGVRSRAWIKIRNVRTTDVIVGGWLPGHGRLSGLPGSLLVGQREAGELRYVGSVGTGWDEAERATLAQLLHIAEIDGCPFDRTPPVPGAHWVLPRLVGEVRYSTRTRTGLLRQPSWHRLRTDLAPEDLE